MSTQVTVTTKERLDLQTESRGPWAAMFALEEAIHLDEELQILVKLRASLINGCVYCIDLHSSQGMRAGEQPERLFALAAWRESSLFSARERAALALTDAATLVTDGHVPDEVWEEAACQFDPPELAQLVWTIGAINIWNRILIGTRRPPGQ